jgi:hypothetical protein
MSGHEREEDHPAGAAIGPAAADTDRSRRRLAAGGLAGAGVLMTLSSRSALGQVVGGCGSESASAALSRTGELPPCGCSPEFWSTDIGLQVWTEFLEIHFPKSASFNDIFSAGLPDAVKPFFVDPAVTLLTAQNSGGVYPETNYSCSGIDKVGMHAVAALLNVQFYGERYPPQFASTTDVIVAFQVGLRGGCEGLEAFKTRVDVYGGMWCFSGLSQGDI